VLPAHVEAFVGQLRARAAESRLLLN